MKIDPNMEFELLLTNISRQIDLDAREVEYLKSVVQFRKLRRRQYLVQAGDVCKFDTFVAKGCLRAYYVDNDGNDHLLQFAPEDWWISDLHSFLTQTPAWLNVDALEESELIQLDKPGLEKLYQTVPKFERYFRIMLQKAFIAHQQRILQNISLTADERYLLFRQKFPSLEQRIPQHQIASYLGITPEFLSKIRKKLAKS
jgi:CRP-like cAMP-binding protein